MDEKTMQEWIAQGWLEGEITFHEGQLVAIDDSLLCEVLERIGAHVYAEYAKGLWTWQEAEDTLQSLNNCQGMWFGMPEIPEEEK